MNSPQQGSHETRTIEAPGDPRTWPLSISIKYVHSSHKSLHPFKSILLAQSHPLQWYRGIIRSLLPFTRCATIYIYIHTLQHIRKRSALIAKVHGALIYEMCHNFSNSQFSFPSSQLFRSLLPPDAYIRTVCPGFSRRLRVFLAGNTSTRWLLAAHPPARPLCSILSFPTSPGLDFAMELQKRMPAASAGGSDGYESTSVAINGLKRVSELEQLIINRLLLFHFL